VIPRFAIALWCLALLPAQLWGAGILVNEYYNGSGLVSPGTKMVADEYIEFVIVQESTAASLASLSFGDSNEATSQLQAVFHFDQATLQQALDNAHLSAFLPGTMIVVKGTDLGPQSIAYDPLNGNWDIQLVAGQGALGSTGTKINGAISVGNKGDTVWVPCPPRTWQLARSRCHERRPWNPAASLFAPPCPRLRDAATRHVTNLHCRNPAP